MIHDHETEMTMNLPKHMPALDGLRGVAILMVVMTHVATGWVAADSIIRDTSISPTFALPWWLSTIAGHAANGVQLFFVVSAFTLTMRWNDGDLGGYALRRLARVGPGYWLAGIAYTLVTGLGPRFLAPHGIGVGDILVASGFGSAWQGGAALALVPGGWSVSCEVSFYIALPILLRLIGGRIWRALSLTTIAVVAAQIVASHVTAAGRYDFPASVWPIEQAPVFLFGVTAALCARRMDLLRAPWLAIALILAVALMLAGIFALPLFPIRNWYLLPHLSFAAVGAVAVTFAAKWPPKLLTGSIIRYLGTVSYSLYLVHFALLGASLWLSERLFPSDSTLTFITHFALAMAMGTAVATLTYRYIELPPMRWASSQGGGRRWTDHGVTATGIGVLQPRHVTGGVGPIA
jgi:peptidoglycan/LPS O-acetylase OafA/YrhL